MAFDIDTTIDIASNRSLQWFNLPFLYSYWDLWDIFKQTQNSKLWL